ncbi:MAG: hypothetical protein ACXAC5_01575 [Promethearchaeota archaeon]
MDTATATKLGFILRFSTLAEIVPALHELGYRARLTDGGILTGMSLEDDADKREFLMLITIDEQNNLDFNCQLATIGDLDMPEEELAGLGWVLLAINAEIQPWAVALINPDGVLSDDDTIVLTDSVPMGDFSTEELEAAMSSFGRALAAVVPTYITKK